MDAKVKRKRDSNPGQNVNWLSRITFFFVLHIFRRSSEEKFNEENVYEQVDVLKSKSLGDMLETQWNIEKTKNKPNILKPIFKVFGVEYALWGFFDMIANTSMMIVKPILMGKIVAYFSAKNANTSKETTLPYVTLLIGSMLISTICSHIYSFSVKQLALKIRIACAAVIYRKSLKLETSATTKSTSGQAITLITKDTIVFHLVMIMFHQLLTGLVKIFAMTYMMYAQVGVAAFAGVSVILLFIPLQAFLGNKTTRYRLATAKKTDARLQLMQEILSTIRTIKMYTWERFFVKSINALRRNEVRSFQILANLKAFSSALGAFNKSLGVYCSIVTFVALGNHLTAEKAYVVIGCFAVLRPVLGVYIPLSFIKIGDLKATFTRMNNYLLQNEVSDYRIFQMSAGRQSIEMKNVSINYENKPVLTNINLSLKPGVTLIYGTIGSGKTALLKAIVGDVRTEGLIKICGNVSYASQIPWLFPGTILKNILFNESFNEERYKRVVNVCALQKDFDLFLAGDQTSLTDKGLNLSKGQRVRINLARAIYREADIYLLDDCLAALDTHIARHIFYNCIKVFLNNKVCVLVSHLSWIQNNADEVVLVNKGCVDTFVSCSRTEEFDNYYEVEDKQNPKLERNTLEDADEYSRVLTKNTIQPTIDMYKENNVHGSIKRNVYYKYISAGGIKVFLLVLSLLVLRQAAESWTDYIVRFWVDSEQNMSSIRMKYGSNSTEYGNAIESHSSVISLYSLVLFTVIGLLVLKALLFYMFASRASINIHLELVSRILNAAMPFFDRTLSGNIINRLSRDLGLVDEQLPASLLGCIEATMSVLAVIIVVSTVNAWFLIPSVCFTLLLVIASCLYVPSGRNIRRIEGSTRSPVIGHMQATFDGLTTIRASGVQDTVKEEFDNHQDFYNTTEYMHLATVEAFGFYLDVLAECYTAVIISALLLIQDNIGAGQAGLALTQSLSLSGLLQWCILNWAELEVQMTSTERVLEYTKIKPEDIIGNIIANWPHMGTVNYKGVSLQYSEKGESILNDLSFTVEPGQKIGIVGRTGAGKTSLISVLFRLYEYQGTITIDEVDINTIAIEWLRSKISIIPQDPIIFTGTIRSNLDPTSRFKDKQLWDALEEVQLKTEIEHLDESVTENCMKFSIGQKQLICLARAILQNNKICVLDEVTDNMDTQTEFVIQNTIKKQFAKSTVIIIAHRLHTVMDCDKILVMDSGAILEYGQTNILLANKDSKFYNMVKHASLLQEHNGPDS